MRKLMTLYNYDKTASFFRRIHRLILVTFETRENVINVNYSYTIVNESLALKLVDETVECYEFVT